MENFIFCALSVIIYSDLSVKHSSIYFQPVNFDENTTIYHVPYGYFNSRNQVSIMSHEK